MFRKTAAAALMVAIAAQSANAVELSRVHVGANYYHNEFNNNNKVRVLGISGGRVEVIFLEGDHAGTIDTVPASDLMTRSESRVEAMGDAAVTVGAGLALLCMLSDSCRERAAQNRSGGSTSPSTSGGGSASSRPAGYDVRVVNSCDRPVRIAVNYKPVDGGWTPAGWWVFDSGEDAVLQYKNKRMKTNSSVIYFYAATTDGAYSWKGDKRVSVGGKTYGMRKAVDKDGETLLKLTCA